MSKTLILVEDNNEHAELASYYISEFDNTIRILRFRDGEEFKSYLQTFNPNSARPWLILLDYKLPKYDGLELLKMAKADQSLSSVPVVVFTTSNADRDIQSALDARANSYIVKPTAVDGYETVINTLLGYWSMDRHTELSSGVKP